MSIRPEVPRPVWQTATLPINIPDSTLTQSISNSFSTEIPIPNHTAAVAYQFAEAYHPTNTLLHTAYLSPHGFIKYHPSISDLNKIDSLSNLIDPMGNPYDIPSTHPRLLSSIVGTPNLFIPAQYPIIQPFTYSTLNPHHNPHTDPSQHQSNIISATSTCHNNFPLDGLSLDEVLVLQSAILSAAQAIVDQYPLPRQVTSYVRSLLFLLLQKFQIYSLGPLNMVPVTLVFCACRLLELPPKYTDLFHKFNNLLDIPYFTTTSHFTTLSTIAQQPTTIPPPSSSLSPHQSTSPFNDPNQQQPIPSNVPSLSAQKEIVAIQFNQTPPWYQEYLLPYLCIGNDLTSSRSQSTGHRLDQVMILRYQFELCHLMHQVRTLTSSELERENDNYNKNHIDHIEGGTAQSNAILSQLPYPDIGTVQSFMTPTTGNCSNNKTPLNQIFSHVTPPPILTQTHNGIEQILNITNTGLNGPSFNESWLQYISTIDHHYVTSSQACNHQPHTQYITLSQPFPTTNISELVLNPSTTHPIQLKIIPHLHHGSFLFQFLLLSLYSAIPLVTNTQRIPPSQSQSDPITVTTDTANPNLSTSLAPPNFTMLDALIYDTSGFKGLHVIMNPLPDIALTILNRLEITIPIGYTIPVGILGATGLNIDQVLMDNVDTILHQQQQQQHHQYNNSKLQSKYHLHSPLIKLDQQLVDMDSVNADFFHFSPDLSNSNSFSHIAAFIYQIALYADQIPLQLMYPPQIISIAIVDLALSMLQLATPVVLPVPAHQSLLSLESGHTTGIGGDNHISNSYLTSQQHQIGEQKNKDAKEEDQHDNPLTLNQYLSQSTPQPNFSNNIMSEHANTIAAQALSNMWVESNTKHFFIQNGFVRRSFHLNTTPTHPDPSHQPLTPAAYWYHTLIPGLDPAIVVSIALSILLGTKLGYLLTANSQSSTLTIRVLALQRYPWLTVGQGLASLPSQLGSIMELYGPWGTDQNDQNDQNVHKNRKTEWKFSHFDINPRSFLSFHSPEKQLQLMDQLQEHVIDANNCRTTQIESFNQQQQQKQQQMSQHQRSNEPISSSRFDRRKQILSGKLSYTELEMNQQQHRQREQREQQEQHPFSGSGPNHISPPPPPPSGISMATTAATPDVTKINQELLADLFD